MSQAVEIFFAVPPDNDVLAVVLPNGLDGPLPQQIALAYRMVGSRSVMDPIIGEQWNAVVVCTPEFAKTNAATPLKGRTAGVRLQFITP